ncbi:MAG: phosphate permease [Candidatus Omnitrophica bacterium CG11_big_fil_rev_8_21_14_0_20_64_10]|nr:MAG: phosphate permease [Candidatus Omnitrophica bacterium CG11_big_fil_rev_8_21_14_0_20_64_10]
MLPLALLAAVLFLAYTNGANDNFKGVATLFGSRTTGYGRAITWATVTTFAGSLTAVWLSQGLIHAFSGNGLVPTAVTAQPAFLLAVGLGAAFTVFLATITGLPISTTHALTGALVGAGLVQAGSVDFARLGQSFFLPLAVSPVLSFALTGGLYPIFRLVRARLGIERQMCLCIGGGRLQPVQIRPDGAAVLQATGMKLSVGQLQECVQRYEGRVIGIDAQWILDRLHYLSAGAVSFARGLNDTPKIVALLLAARGLGLSPSTGIVAVGIAMAVGGLLNARKVAVTVSQRITPMNHGQGFTANLVTSGLVTMASLFGLPVSTTHVSCGSLFGLGAVNRTAQWKVIQSIVLSWVATLPLAAGVGAVIAWGIGGVSPWPFP